MERQNPTGTQPPDDPNKTESTSKWISPRLREKLMEAESGMSREKEDGMPAWVPVVLVILVVGGGGGLLMMMRSSSEHAKVEAARKANVARADSIATAHADSIRSAALADSARAAALAAGPAKDAKTPPAKSAPPAKGTAAAKPAAGAAASARPAGGAAKPAGATKGAAAGGAAAAVSEPPATPAAPKETGPFGIQVASFIVEDRANSEKDKLTAATGLAGQVKNDDGNFVVLLGSYKTRAAAERAAEPLLTKGLVGEARVVPIGKP